MLGGQHRSTYFLCSAIIQVASIKVIFKIAFWIEYNTLNHTLKLYRKFILLKTILDSVCLLGIFVNVNNHLLFICLWRIPYFHGNKTDFGLEWLIGFFFFFWLGRQQKCSPRTPCWKRATLGMHRKMWICFMGTTFSLFLADWLTYDFDIR